jgi:hypothetical protein
LGVLLGHFIRPMFFVNLGEPGVSLVFVLSGRLTAEILFVRCVSRDQFYRRRFSASIRRNGAGADLYAGEFLIPDLRISAADVAATPTFTVNYLRQINRAGDGTLTHVSSLCVGHAYEILPLVALAQRRFGIDRVPVALTLAAAAMANGVVQGIGLTPEAAYRLWFFTDTRISSVLAAVAAYLGLRGRLAALPPANRAWLSIGALVTGIACSAFIAPMWTRYSIAPVCYAISVAILDCSTPVVRQLLFWRALAFVGICPIRSASGSSRSRSWFRAPPNPPFI